jgi:hypothetical protein
MLEIDGGETPPAEADEHRDPLVVGALTLLRTGPETPPPPRAQADVVDRIAALCADLGLSSGGEATDTAVREALAEAWDEESKPVP